MIIDRIAPVRCHPNFAGLYTDPATKRAAYIVDDFGNAVRLVEHRGLMEQWSRLVVESLYPEH